jgi:hypothetical protein
MQWAVDALDYLYKARRAARQDFDNLMAEMREDGPQAQGAAWFSTVKSVILSLKEYTQDFVADRAIPGSNYGSPAAVADALEDYRAFVDKMRHDVVAAGEHFHAGSTGIGYPDIIHSTLKQVNHTLAAVDHVIALRPDPKFNPAQTSDLQIVERLARRFHASARALRYHPHGGTIWTLQDEWDCQYLFHAILAGFFPDIRIEEPNPSLGGSSTRCEFYLKPQRLMIELKFARPGKDKKILEELIVDRAHYGANPNVNHMIALVYDPDGVLKHPDQLEADLSGATADLQSVICIVAPKASGV